MATCMPRLDKDYACISDDRYIHTYIYIYIYIYIKLITYIDPTNYEVRRYLAPQIFTTPSV